MELKDFYSQIGGNYDEVKQRLMDDKRVLKFLNKFLDTTDYEDLQQALAAENWEDAFRFSHNLKGMALNLSLGRLAESSCELCETMRHGAPAGGMDGIAELRETVGKNYAEVIGMIPTLS